jgi:hypothetical protein
VEVAPKHLTAPVLVTDHERVPPAVTAVMPEPSPTTSTGLPEVVVPVPQLTVEVVPAFAGSAGGHRARMRVPGPDGGHAGAQPDDLDGGGGG